MASDELKAGLSGYFLDYDNLKQYLLQIYDFF